MQATAVRELRRYQILSDNQHTGLGYPALRWQRRLRRRLRKHSLRMTKALAGDTPDIELIKTSFTFNDRLLNNKTCKTAVCFHCLHDRSHLDELAEKSGLSLSNTIRACINGTELRERQSAEIKDLYTEINRIGTNINQIARKINAGIGTKSDVRETLFLLSKVYQLMEQVAER